MTLKSEIINGAYSRMRVSGLTVQPTPEDNAVALDRLEDLAEELRANNVCVGYNFEETPGLNSFTNIARKFKSMLETNLAVRLCPDFGKDVPLALASIASGALSSAASITASKSIQQVQYPQRMPLGNGNSRGGRHRRYQSPSALPPNECATKIIEIGEINDYKEDFSSYLSGEAISSYAITADAGLNIESDSNDDPVISYRIKASSNATEGSWQQVKIQITTDAGRVEIRVINFDVRSVPAVT